MKKRTIHISIQHYVILFFTLLVVSTSCKRNIPEDDIDLGKEYFPLIIGKHVVYTVDSFLYNDFTKKIDSFHYEIKNEIDDTFRDNENRLSYHITQYKRYTQQQPWLESQTFYITPTAFNVEVVENNLRFIKLVFPVRLNTRWNGNVYIPSSNVPELQWLSGWDYRYVNINESYNNGFLYFDNTVTVNQANNYAGDSTDANKYSQRTFSREMYAKNIGLIQREIVNWDYQDNVTKYRNGFIIIQKAIAHN